MGFSSFETAIATHGIFCVAFLFQFAWLVFGGGAGMVGNGMLAKYMMIGFPKHWFTSPDFHVLWICYIIAEMGFAVYEIQVGCSGLSEEQAKKMGLGSLILNGTFGAVAIYYGPLCAGVLTEWSYTMAIVINFFFLWQLVTYLGKSARAHEKTAEAMYLQMP